MKRYGFWVLTAIALTLASCQRSPEVSEADSSETISAQSDSFNQSLPTPPSKEPAKPRLSTDFSSPSVSASQASSAKGAKTSASSAGSLAANLKQSLNAGRDNPFRSVHQPQVEVTYVTQSASVPELPDVPQVVATAAAPTVPAVVNASSPASLAPAPVTAVVTAAPLPMPTATPASLPMVVPPAVPPTAIPQVALVSPVPISPTAIAESIEIKGVVQVGEQFNIIIRDPNAPTSRTVKVGDVVGGGKVRISRVDAADSREPQVVLEQDGVEVVRAVGV